MFIVNDRPDLAGLSRAHGVHLGRDDMTVADARSVLPESALVGISTHTREQALASAAEAPDYLAVGPMVATPTKPQEHIAGPSTLKAVAQDTSLPLVAIGGINLSNAMEVLSAAPCCLAVCSAVISQPDPEEAARQFRTLIQP